MNKSKCTHKRCDEPEELGCHIPGCEDYRKCENWQKANNFKVSKNIEDVEEIVSTEIDTATVNWTGNSMGLNNLWRIKNRSVPIIIGVVGLFNSGKTTFLSMLYLLLAIDKRIGDFHFSGSYSLIGWENISWSMRWNKNGLFSFPAHTSADIGRNQGYLHIALRKGNVTRDVIFTDVPGEWFAKWMGNSEHKEAEGARKIIKEADGFIFFVDCDGLNQTNPHRTLIRSNTEKLAARLNNHLEDRPIALLWSKADTKQNIKEKTLTKLESKLNSIFSLSKTFDVSYLEVENQHYHQNILKSIDWIIKELEEIPRPAIEIKPTNTQDYFFNYRGA